jgi:hypothetical protein
MFEKYCYPTDASSPFLPGETAAELLQKMEETNRSYSTLLPSTATTCLPNVPIAKRSKN